MHKYTHQVELWKDCCRFLNRRQPRSILSHLSPVWACPPLSRQPSPWSARNALPISGPKVANFCHCRSGLVTASTRSSLKMAPCPKTRRITRFWGPLTASGSARRFRGAGGTRGTVLAKAARRCDRYSTRRHCRYVATMPHNTSSLPLLSMLTRRPSGRAESGAGDGVAMNLKFARRPKRYRVCVKVLGFV